MQPAPVPLLPTFAPEGAVLVPLSIQPAALWDQRQELVGRPSVQVRLPDGTALTQHDVSTGQ